MRNDKMVTKVNRQIKILKLLNHPNIIKLYEALITTEDICVILQLASQGQLFNFVQNYEVTEQRARFYFKQIISAVEYLHQNRITHRDIKLENILMVDDNLIKLGDFGLSNFMDDGNLLQSQCGSPSYCPPEIIENKSYEGTSVDIWSCGVALFFILTNTFPFESDLEAKLHKKIIGTVNPVAADLIRRMLQKDPCKRIKASEIKDHPWLAYQIPIHLKFTNLFRPESRVTCELDTSCFNEVLRLNIVKEEEFDQQKLVKSILNRSNESFAIAYELVKDQKQKSFAKDLNLRRFNSDDDDQEIVPILRINNSITKYEHSIKKKNHFGFGNTYSKRPDILGKLITQSLFKLNIKYTIKKEEFSIKCAYTPPLATKQNHQINANEADQIETEENKGQSQATNIIKFVIHVYSVAKNSNEHLVDLQLLQGHPITFCNISNKFFANLGTLTATA